MGEPPTRPNMDKNFENDEPTGTPNNQNTSNGENTTSTDTETTSTKGIKAGTNITIENGTLNIDDLEMNIKAGESIFIPAQKNRLQVKGDLSLIFTHV